MRSRRARSLLSVLVLGGVSVLASPATSAEIRTETELGGYSVDVEAAPFRVLIDDPTIPIPRPEESALLEADPSYTAAALATGPNSRATASSLWPGNLIGDGLATAANNPDAGYPIKVQARYPDKPYTATTRDGGELMNAQAFGLDVVGAATGVPQSIAGQVGIGSIASNSSATVLKGVASGTSISKISDVDLLAGVIHVGSVSTTLTTRSDGLKATSSGSTVVSGLTVAGHGFVVDDKGVHAEGQGGALPSTAGLSALKAAGVTIEGVTQTSSGTADTASRTAQGLRITVDTVILRGAIDSVASPLYPTLRSLFSQTPGEAQGNLNYLLSATPRLTFVLGAGNAVTAAVQALSFNFPPIDLGGGFTPSPPITPPAQGGEGIGGEPFLPGTDGSVDLPAPGQPPTVNQPFNPQALAGALIDPFAGVPAGMVLGAGLLAGLAGWGLLALRGLALTGGLFRRSCPLGAPSDLVDLHGA